MFLEMAIADAYGAGFEYARPDFVRRYNTLGNYIQHQKHKELKAGCYTDDTQMSIAIAELLIDGVKWEPLSIANKFVSVFKRDQRVGYAGGFYKLLCEVKDGEELLARLKGNNKSDKSGAAMRALPIGCQHITINHVLAHAEVQAKVTHDTPDGIRAAQAAALLAFYFKHECGPRKEVGQFINKHVAGQWATPYEDSVGAQGWMSVRAAITAVTTCASLSDVLRRSIAFCGDVDTVATLAVGAASMCDDEMIYDIPEHLMTGLENGKYGRGYLEKLQKEFDAALSIPF